MAKKCNELNEAVKITKGFNGTYKTKNKLTDKTYSYYCQGKDVHFTIDDTGGGKSDFKKFHITYGSFNAHVWYNANGKRLKDDPENPAYNKNVPGSKQAEWSQWLTDNLTTLDAIAKEFAGAV